MRIRLLMLGKTRRPEMRAILDDYVRRISRSCPIEINEVRDADAAFKKLDADRAATAVLLDAGGRSIDSNAPDNNQPSAAIEIPLEKPLPDYDLHQLEQPTPRDVDAILVSQGFRDLVDDARGILTELLSGTSLELAQFTGAICPGDDETYRPGLWIVLRDKNSAQGRELSSESRTRISAVAEELVKRLQLI